MKPLRLILPVLALALPGTALAQGMVRPAPQAAPRAAAAPALPGLAARPSPAPIQGESNANLSPNAALFDAINRGDLAAARDAVSRGANVDARNALGLTALDAAVDQGRNEIAFFLLSAREVASAGAPPPGAANPRGLNAPPTAAERAQARREAQAAEREARQQEARQAARAPAAPRAPRLWAGDGGAPQPQIGFLGFDAGRPAGAAPAEPRRGGRG